MDPITGAIVSAAASKLTNNLWQIFNKGDGTASVKLDGPYTLKLDEKMSEIKIVNSQTKEVTQIWGDPHVDYNKDGKTDFDFWGTTTFKLNDGTKITVNTEPYNGNKNEFLSNNIVVTKGEQSLVINGLSLNKLGDLKIMQGMNGRQLDKLVPDGKLVLRENPNGEGWLTRDNKMVTQADGNTTRPDAGKESAATDFNKQLQTMFYGNTKDAGDIGKRKGATSWYEAFGNALGANLKAQADEIIKLSDQVTKLNGKDDPALMTSLTTASQKMGFLANGSMTAINSVGDALSSLARKG